MSNPSGVSRPAHGRSLVWAAGLALLGVLSMHGWATHAAHAAPGGGSGTPPAAAEKSPSASGTVGHGGPAETAGTARWAETDDGSCGDCHLTGSWSALGLATMCLAVLGSVIGIAVAMRRQRAYPLPGAWWPSVDRRVPVSRDRDPPDAARLCVIRC